MYTLPAPPPGPSVPCSVCGRRLDPSLTLLGRHLDAEPHLCGPLRAYGQWAPVTAMLTATSRSPRGVEILEGFTTRDLAERSNDGRYRESA
jgi:hypothetical protein